MLLSLPLCSVNIDYGLYPTAVESNLFNSVYQWDKCSMLYAHPNRSYELAVRSLPYDDLI